MQKTGEGVKNLKWPEFERFHDWICWKIGKVFEKLIGGHCPPAPPFLMALTSKLHQKLSILNFSLRPRMFLTERSITHILSLRKRLVSWTYSKIEYFWNLYANSLGKTRGSGGASLIKKMCSSLWIHTLVQMLFFVQPVQYLEVNKFRSLGR